MRGESKRAFTVQLNLSVDKLHNIGSRALSVIFASRLIWLPESELI